MTAEDREALADYIARGDYGSLDDLGTSNIAMIVAALRAPPAGRGAGGTPEQIASIIAAERGDTNSSGTIAERIFVAPHPPSEDRDDSLPERETWWLAERIGHQQYTAELGELPSLTNDPWRAVRFKTEREAFEYILRLKTLRDEMQQTEHIFINKPHREHRYSFPPRDTSLSIPEDREALDIVKRLRAPPAAEGAQGRCDVTLTERFSNPNCRCPTYAGNLGPCKTFEAGASGLCVYCDHNEVCHAALRSPSGSAVAMREAQKLTEVMILAGGDVLLDACSSDKGHLHPWKPFDVAQVAIKVWTAMAALAAPQPQETKSLCSCKASDRDGQHMAWCPSLTRPLRASE